MGSRGILLLVIVLVVAACSGGDATVAGESTTATQQAVPTATTGAPPSTIPPSTTTASRGPVLVPQVEVTGPEETVFDWASDRCEDENIPDIAARAFRDATGQVQLIIGHYYDYRMVGPTLDDVASDCSGPVLVSAFDPDPSRFNDSSWIAAPYTLDGQTVYALVHNEYRGDTHGGARPDQCPSGERYTCLDTSITEFVSTDGGAIYNPIEPSPNNMVATLPYVFNDEGVPSGLRQPSNIIQGPDGYYYNFSNVSDYPDEDQWVCAMRTDDLGDPTSWRFWNGTDFSGAFVDPYVDTPEPDTEKCAPLALPQLTASVQEAVVYDEVLGKYVMMGTSAAPNAPDPHWGVYYSLSDDLIHWTIRRLLLELPSYPSVGDENVDPFYAYVSILDPDSGSMNFETTNGSAYLYITHFNAGTHSLDRDLVRYPIELKYVEATAPEWDFGTDGDRQGWMAVNDLAPLAATGGSLVTESIGDDPYLVSGQLQIPAEFNRMTIRMKVSSGSDQTGQLFFGTDTRPDHTEDASLVFDVSGDAAFHDYELDLSRVAGWQGTIVSLRLDPVIEKGRKIEIDRMWFES